MPLCRGFGAPCCEVQHKRGTHSARVPNLSGGYKVGMYHFDAAPRPPLSTVPVPPAPHSSN